MEELQALLSNLPNLLEHKTEVCLAITTTIAAGAAIAACTPTPKDDSVFRWLRKVIDFVGLNLRHATNEKVEKK